MRERMLCGLSLGRVNSHIKQVSLNGVSRVGSRVEVLTGCGTNRNKRAKQEQSRFEMSEWFSAECLCEGTNLEEVEECSSVCCNSPLVGWLVLRCMSIFSRGVDFIQHDGC